MALALQRTGYNNTHINGKDTTIPPESSHLKVQLLSTHTKVPSRSTHTSADLDLYYPSKVVIEPNSTVLIAMYISLKPMTGTYAQIATCNNFAQKGASTIGGVIDPDYRGNITITVHKSSSKSLYIEQDSIFVQLILKHIWAPTVEVVPRLSPTRNIFLRTLRKISHTQKSHYLYYILHPHL